MKQEKKTAPVAETQERQERLEKKRFAMNKWWIPIILNAVAITVGLIAIGLSLMQLAK